MGDLLRGGRCIGDGVGMGKDHTLFALDEGHVWYQWVPRNEKIVSQVSVKPFPKPPRYDVPAPL